MPLSHIQVDDRLVHVQLVEGWLKPLAVERVLVASDACAGDPVRKAALEMAAPPGVQVLVLGLGTTLEWIRANHSDPRKTVLLTDCPADAAILAESGVRAPSVTVIGLHRKDGVQVSASVVLSEEDCRALKRIVAQGLRVTAQSLPADPSRDLAGYFS